MARVRVECYVKIIRTILLISILVVLLLAYRARKLHKNEVASQIPKDALKYIFFERKMHGEPKSIQSISRLIHLNNQQRNILNEETFGPIDKDTVIFVITVRKLSIYLEFLLVSLSQVRGIERALIIFSHSYFDDDVNDLIQSIDFARVLPLYYPYSVQMYPNEFPGFHPLDCPHTMSVQDAEAANCTGASASDIHGLYRNPAWSEMKHQWWWTANTVFETISLPINHTGAVIFVKDDLYLLQDFIFMIISMTQTAEYLPKFDFMALDAKPDLTKSNAYRVDIEKWIPNNSPDVLAFDIKTWNSIVSHYDLFCSIDDYSWARSLYYISVNRRDGPTYRVMRAALARSYKTSSCGLESKLVDCDAIESVYQVLDLQKKMKDELYPSYLEAYTLVELPDEYDSLDYADCNGGWNDPRDKELCHVFTFNKIETNAKLDGENEM